MLKTDSGNYKLTPGEMEKLKQEHDAAIQREREARYTLSQVGVVVGGMRNAFDSIRGNITKVATLLADLEHAIETETEKKT